MRFVFLKCPCLLLMHMSNKQAATRAYQSTLPNKTTEPVPPITSNFERSVQGPSVIEKPLSRPSRKHRPGTCVQKTCCLTMGSAAFAKPSAFMKPASRTGTAVMEKSPRGNAPWQDQFGNPVASLFCIECYSVSADTALICSKLRSLEAAFFSRSCEAAVVFVFSSFALM